MRAPPKVAARPLATGSLWEQKGFRAASGGSTMVMTPATPDPISDRHGLGATRLSRALLSFATMCSSWLVSLALLAMLKVTFEPGLEIPFLASWSGIFSAVTFCIFVVPLVTVFSRRVQLRFFYLVVLCSFGWDALVMRWFFQEWPWTIWFHESGFLFLAWFGEFTCVALAIYFAMLWRGAHAGARAVRQSRPIEADTDFGAGLDESHAPCIDAHERP